MLTKDRVIELDIIKVVGILLVVFAHVTRMYTPQALIPNEVQSYFLQELTHVIYTFHMPLFVFVSGLTFGIAVLRDHRYQDFKGFVWNKFKRLMIPYFVFAFCWVMPFMLLYGFKTNLKNFIINDILLSYDCRHLWYVWMLFNVFILFYILKKLFSKLHLPVYSLLFVSIILYIFQKVINISIFNCFQINSMLIYQLYFVIGYMVSYYRNMFIRYMLIFLCAGFLLADYLGPWKAPLLALSGILFFYLIAPLGKCLVNSKCFKLIAKNVFGIYLFHPIIIYILFYYFSHCFINSFVFVFISFLVSLILSCVLVELVRICHVQVIIGERKLSI